MTDRESAYAYAHDDPLILTDPLGLKSYWDYEKEFMLCIDSCLGLSAGAAAAGWGTANFFKECFTRGRWIGGSACAAAMAKAAKAAAAAMRTPGGQMSKAGMVCVGIAEVAMLTCEYKCYRKLLK